MSFIKLAISISALIFGLGKATPLFAAHHHHGDPPSVHGMLLFGNDNLYLSHLPMFHPPHDYQVILKIALSEEAKSTYFTAKKNDPQESVYTIVPEVFSLPDVVLSGQSFKATIFKGHFERGGVPITEQVSVEISEVVYFKKFEPSAQHPEKATYVVFGSGTELFAAHLISVKPDFDQIIEVGVHPQLLSALNTSAYIRVEVPSIDGETPLMGSSSFEAIAYSNTQTPIPLKVFQTGGEIYLEFNDLSF